MLCAIVLLIPDPVGAKNTEDNKAVSSALSALQDLTNSGKGVSFSMTNGQHGQENATVSMPSLHVCMLTKLIFTINLLQETDEGEVTVLQRVIDVVINLLNLNEV